MSDQLENFIRNNRDKLDQNNPGSEVWNNLQQGLAQNAAAGSAASGSAAAAKTGLGAKIAQVSTFWKAAAGIVATVAVGAAIFVATTTGGGDKKDPQNETIVTDNSGGGQKVEVLEATMPLVNPPLPSADIPFKTHEIDAKKGGRWVLENGTVITVPKNAFVDGEGNKIKGMVTLQYREFHDAADIILSGIPMVYYDNGKPENFQTAGMTELKGTQGESPIYVSPEKNLEISMASFPEEDNYNLYFLDPEQREWQDVGKADLGPNKEKKKRIRMLPAKPQKPKKPSKAQGENLDYAINLKVEYGDFPELKPFKNIMWEALDREYFRKNQWSLTRKWNDVTLEEINAETAEYRLVFSNRKTTFKLKVTPMLEGADYDKAMAKFQKKLDRYDKLFAKRQDEERRIAEQADFSRTFKISGFGIMNCDRFYNLDECVTVNATVELPDEAYALEDNLLIYQITGDNRAVFTRNMKEMKSLKYIPTDNNMLVCILGGEKVGLFDNDDFKKINMDEVRETGSATFKFEMIERKIRNAADLRLAIGI